MVLDHVAKRARLLVVRAAGLHPQGLAHRDLDVVHVVAIPQRLEDPVGEAEDQDVLDGLLPEVVVDPVDLVLGEDAAHHLVEGPRGREVASERLLDDDADPGVGALARACGSPPRRAG